MQELSELVYVLRTKSRSVLCIPMGIHRNELAANLNLKEHQFFFTHPVQSSLYSYNKQITSWLVRLYDFYYSLVVKDR